MSKKVFVSGCYDMLHSGHVAFLEEASHWGDLYVGLGSDETIWELKRRKPVNSNAERLYMVKALRCVKDAWINSGSGVMDFEKEVSELKPDYFFVNSDGYSPEKRSFCERLGIQLIVSERIPEPGLPARSTTALRQECQIPYRVEICGGWMDQLSVNSLTPGPVIVMSVEPLIEFNDKSGMATSSRQKAIEMWQTKIPAGNREKLARLLFCVENPPGSTRISGSQDQLGILLPGLNKLNYDNDFWPVSIESRTDAETLNFVSEHLRLIALPPRRKDYDVLKNTNINAVSAQKLAQSAEDCWKAINNRNLEAWGKSLRSCFAAQLEMFPEMSTPEINAAVEEYRDRAYGWKVSGCGGGGYLILITDKNIPEAIKLSPRI